MLNEAFFFSVRPDVEFRVYGHYAIECDLSFAARLTNVRRSAADCLTRASHVEAIAQIPRLDALSLGIFESQDFRVLEFIPPCLTTLRLGPTRSTRPRLDMLGRFTSLTNLSLDGHNYGLAVLGDLLSLEALTLRSITTPDLGYLAPLQRLRFLDIKLGGIRSFQGVEGKDSIKYLELLRIRELSDAGVVGALPGLQHLSLESLPRITSLPRLDRSRALRRVVLQNLKGLHDFTAFEAAPALEQFALIRGDKQQPSQLLPVLRNPAVRGAKGHFGSARKDSAFERLREAHCKQDWDIGSSFEYR